LFPYDIILVLRFVTGAADRVIKIWDLASGKLKLSLTGHVSTVRGVVVSPRHPYLFSGGEDRQVKCWDLEYNKVCNFVHQNNELFCRRYFKNNVLMFLLNRLFVIITVI